MTTLQEFDSKLKTLIQIVPPIAEENRYRAWFQMLYLETEAIAKVLGIVAVNEQTANSANVNSSADLDDPKVVEKKREIIDRDLQILEDLDDQWDDDERFFELATCVFECYRMGGTYFDLIERVSNVAGLRFIDWVQCSCFDEARHELSFEEIHDKIDEFFCDEDDMNMFMQMHKERTEAEIKKWQEQNISDIESVEPLVPEKKTRLKPIQTVENEVEEDGEENDKKPRRVVKRPYLREITGNTTMAYKVNGQVDREELMFQAIDAIGKKGWNRNENGIPVDGRRLFIADTAMTIGMEEAQFRYLSGDEDAQLYKAARQSEESGSEHLAPWLRREERLCKKATISPRPVKAPKQRKSASKENNNAQSSGFEADFDFVNGSLATYLRDGVRNMQINHKDYCLVPKAKLRGRQFKQIYGAFNNLYYTHSLEERYTLWESKKFPDHYLIGKKNLPQWIRDDFNSGTLSIGDKTVKAPVFSLPTLREKIEEARTTGSAVMDVMGFTETEVEKSVMDLLAKLHCTGKVDFVVTDGNLILENRE